MRAYLIRRKHRLITRDFYHPTRPSGACYALRKKPRGIAARDPENTPEVFSATLLSELLVLYIARARARVYAYRYDVVHARFAASASARDR